MSDLFTRPDDCYAAVLDAVQRAVIDKRASKATRKAAFSALSALVEAGGEAGETSLSSAARDRSTPGQTLTAYFGRRYRFAFSQEKTRVATDQFIYRVRRY